MIWRNCDTKYRLNLLMRRFGPSVENDAPQQIEEAVAGEAALVEDVVV
jgi:hypothetical protein